MAATIPHNMLRSLRTSYPWIRTPLIVGAPMLRISGPSLAVAVSRAGGIGFVGPGKEPAALAPALETVRQLLSTASTPFPEGQRHDSEVLPIGVGFQIWNADIEIASKAISTYRPAAVWLFAPRNGQQDIDTWTSRFRNVSPRSQIWIQVGSVKDAIDAANSAHAPDVLVAQGADAGGHGRTIGAGIISLLPEVRDALKNSNGGANIPVVAAGGIADGRGSSAAITLGAAGVAMGTRFLAAAEAEISAGYQNEVVRANDGGQTTVRTKLYNALRGTKGWPEIYTPRGLTNQSFLDHEAGMNFEENKRLHDIALEMGDEGWGPKGRLTTYAGTAVGLVREVQGAAQIVEAVRADTIEALKSAASLPWG